MLIFVHFAGNSAYSMDSASITLPTATVAPPFIDDSDPQLLHSANTSYHHMQQTTTSATTSTSASIASFQSYFSGFLERNYTATLLPPSSTCSYTSLHSPFTSPPPIACTSQQSTAVVGFFNHVDDDELPVYNPLLSPPHVDDSEDNDPNKAPDFIQLGPPDEASSSDINDLLETSRNRIVSLRSATKISAQLLETDTVSLQKENQQPETNNQTKVNGALRSPMQSRDGVCTRTQTQASLGDAVATTA
jgi:hypothetical protein